MPTCAGATLQRAAPDRARQQEAAEAFRAALAEDSGVVLAQSALCATEARRFEYWNDTGAHARARLACARVEDADPMPAEAALALGNLDRVDGRFTEALRRFRLAAGDPASAALAVVGLGKVSAARGQRDRARSHFQAALDVAPDDAQVRAEVGFQAYRDGRLEDATASYRRALELAPDNAGYWNTYGFLWLLQGNAAEAARAFERSIAIEPSADVLANFATLRGQAGEHDAALALYRRALELDPEDYLNWGNLADGLAASRGGGQRGGSGLCRGGGACAATWRWTPAAAMRWRRWAGTAPTWDGATKPCRWWRVRARRRWRSRRRSRCTTPRRCRCWAMPPPRTASWRAQDIRHGRRESAPVRCWESEAVRPPWPRRHPAKGRRGALTGPQHSTTRRHRHGQQETSAFPGRCRQPAGFRRRWERPSGTADDRQAKAGTTRRRPKSGGPGPASTPAMLRAGAVRAQRGQVRGRAVALVAIKAVGREFAVQGQHGAIARHLGQDGRGRDAAVAGIAADPGLGGAGQSGRDRVAVDPGQPGHVRHRLHGAAHAEHGGLVDVDAVDLGGVDRHHVPGQGAVDDARVQLFAARVRELLGVVEAVDPGTDRVEHHGRDDHRPGERSTAGLVDARDQRGHRRRTGRRGARADAGQRCALPHDAASAGADTWRGSSSSATAVAASREASRRSCRCRSR